MITSGVKTRTVYGYPGNFGPDIRTVGVRNAPLRPLTPPSESSSPSSTTTTTGSHDLRYACVELPPNEAKAVMGTVAVALRGECSFVTKARNVQKAGGLGLVVLDSPEAMIRKITAKKKGFRFGWGHTMEEYSEGEAWEGVDTSRDDITAMNWQVMADDGTGEDIFLPVALIKDRQAKYLYRLLLSPEAHSKDGLMVQMSPDENLGVQPLATLDFHSSAAGKEEQHQQQQSPPTVDNIFTQFVEGVSQRLGFGSSSSSSSSKIPAVQASHEDFGSAPEADEPPRRKRRGEGGG